MQDLQKLLKQEYEEEIEVMMRTFKKYKVYNEIVFVQGRKEGVHYLFHRIMSDGRHGALHCLMVRNLKPPIIDGPEELKSIRKDEWSTLLPMVIHTS